MRSFDIRYRTSLIFEALETKGYAQKEVLQEGHRYCPGRHIGLDIRDHKIDDEMIAMVTPSESSLLADNYRALVKALGDDVFSSVASLVSSMFAMHRDGLVENGGKSANGDRIWRPTIKAEQLGKHYGLDLPVGPLKMNWDGLSAPVADNVVSWHLGFLIEQLLDRPEGPLIEAPVDGDKIRESLFADLQEFLVSSGLADTLIGLTGEGRIFLVASSKLQKQANWLLAERRPKKKDVRRLYEMTKRAAFFLANGSSYPSSLTDNLH